MAAPQSQSESERFVFGLQAVDSRPRTEGRFNSIEYKLKTKE